MTVRLYYADSRLLSFDAIVEACVPAAADRFELRLDRTAFYPTSGGQPFDTGRIGGAAVVDVIDRDDGGIAHVVTGQFEPGTRVQAEIDGTRRCDHMEQHTGQHVLSAAFERVCDVATVGFHMGAETSTIDLAREVTAAEIAEAEHEANGVIRENRAVTVRIVSAEQAQEVPLRRPSARSGPLRIVEVTDFDVSACGGTHVAWTGAIGLVAVVGTERVRAGTRLTFVCGGRALGAMQRLRDTAAEIARLLGVGPGDIGAHVARAQHAARDADRQARQAREALAECRAASWRETAEIVGRYRAVVRSAGDAEAGELKLMAQAMTSAPGLVVVLVGAGEPAAVVVARSGDVDFDAAVFMRAAVAALGGRGGGRAELAQGGLAATPDAIEVFARRALSTAT